VDATVVHYLALKGGKYQVGSFNKSTNTSVPVDQAVSGVGFRPVGLLLASKNNTSGTSISNDARITFGAGDSKTEVSTWWFDEDNLQTMEANNITKTHLRAHTFGVSIPAHGDCEYCNRANVMEA
jgi:hypothetical protein